ncbi:MAG: glucose-6-phosphate isomerase [Bacteroides sp. SM23_62_1]|nr:MAG: glucose-6-phosphate isomerase [Bacteroides sp. SM23_62_1]
MAELKLDISNVFPFVTKEIISGYKKDVKQHLESLHNKTGPGSEMTGWVDLPSRITEDYVDKIEKTADELSDMVDIVVVIGIGGSFLGAKAIIHAISHNFEYLIEKKKAPFILFAGQNIGEDYLSELIEVLNHKKYAIIVISKSGTTTEPAIAFRILKNHLERQIGVKEAGKRIIAITDQKKGALRILADQRGYTSFVIPEDVGGRYSVLAPVGLLPVATAGLSIRKFIDGARTMEKRTGLDVPFEDNPSAIYASTRNALYRAGKNIEILANYNNKLIFLSEWWKQLYGESEGKEHKGIFPASVNFTADLHSMGQYIQEGTRNLFEIVISATHTDHTLIIPDDEDNLDQLNFLSGKRIDDVNKMAELGTILAHVDGGVPNIRIVIPEINEYHLGELIYFFEKACGISGYLLGINPFNQPGVEAYKKNMFALLEKPGFEEETKKIWQRIGR